MTSTLSPKRTTFDPMAELDRVGAELLSGKGVRLAAGYGDDMNPLAELQGRDSENGRLMGRVFVTRSDYFDPTKDSLLFDGRDGGGNVLRRDRMTDGSTTDVYADGYANTDADGNTAFTRANTSVELISGKAFDDVVSRFKYLDHKYDPNSWGDRFLNVFTGAMDDSSRVLGDNERIERDALKDRINVAVDRAVNPEHFSPVLQHLDNIRGSAAGTATYLAARSAGMDLETQRKYAQLGKAVGDVGFARAAAVQGGPAYTNAKGTPALTEPAGGYEKNVRAREMYMGATPDKYSRTGREVLDRMRTEGKILGEGPLLRGNPNNLRLVNPDGSIVRIDGSVDMAHRVDAVTWWNQSGRFFGPKTPEVRQFMLDSSNYTLQLGSVNSSAGARLGITYLPPVPPEFNNLKR